MLASDMRDVYFQSIPKTLSKKNNISGCIWHKLFIQTVKCSFFIAKQLFIKLSMAEYFKMFCCCSLILELLFKLQFCLWKELILIDSSIKVENTSMRLLLLQCAAQKYSINLDKLSGIVGSSRGQILSWFLSHFTPSTALSSQLNSTRGQHVVLCHIPIS